jgi:hypothetical protein
MMMTRKLLLLLLCLALIPAFSLAQPLPQPDSFLHQVLRFLGVSVNSATLKADVPIEAGEIWMVDLKTLTPFQLTSGGNYRSPVFMPGDKYVLVLQGKYVVKVPLQKSKSPKKLYKLEKIRKLVGFGKDRQEQNKLLVLLEEPDFTLSVNTLLIKSGRLTKLSYNTQSSTYQDIINHLESWERDYGDLILYPDKVTKPIIGGTQTWTDIYLKRKGQQQAQQLSQCDGINCSQPNLSYNKRYVVFIKAVP